MSAVIGPDHAYFEQPETSEDRAYDKRLDVLCSDPLALADAVPESDLYDALVSMFAAMTGPGPGIEQWSTARAVMHRLARDAADREFNR